MSKEETKIRVKEELKAAKRMGNTELAKLLKEEVLAMLGDDQ